jgi:hypothetical protein
MKAKREKGKIEQYEEGYRRHPECIDGIKALEQLSADAFAQEGWK